MTIPADAPGTDPMAVFAQWRLEAEGRVPDPDAVALATATRDGRPSVRFVLLRGIDEAGVRFYTGYDSRKGRELAENPRCALAWFDAAARRAVRLEGTAAPLGPEGSDAYFASRARGHQLGAVASRQSTELADRAALEAAYQAAEAAFAGREVTRPDRWGGYLVTPTAVELWIQRDDRLHDRFAYARAAQGWSAVRLAP